MVDNFSQKKDKDLLLNKLHVHQNLDHTQDYKGVMMMVQFSKDTQEKQRLRSLDKHNFSIKDLWSKRFYQDIYQKSQLKQIVTDRLSNQLKNNLNRSQFFEKNLQQSKKCIYSLSLIPRKPDHTALFDSKAIECKIRTNPLQSQQ